MVEKSFDSFVGQDVLKRLVAFYRDANTLAGCKAAISLVPKTMKCQFFHYLTNLFLSRDALLPFLWGQLLFPS